MIKTLQFINKLEEEHPTTGCNADDGRYTYPERWKKLKAFIREEQMDAITADKIFDIIAPNSRPDACVNITRERLQQALDKMEEQDETERI